jgi:hypothetical protein
MGMGESVLPPQSSGYYAAPGSRECWRPPLPRALYKTNVVIFSGIGMLLLVLAGIRVDAHQRAP